MFKNHLITFIIAFLFMFGFNVYGQDDYDPSDKDVVTISYNGKIIQQIPLDNWKILLYNIDKMKKVYDAEQTGKVSLIEENGQYMVEWYSENGIVFKRLTFNECVKGL